MMKCDHYAVITLSVVDNKITLGCVGRASDARRVYDFSCTRARRELVKRKKQRSCLTIQISCYLMAHIIIIKSGEVKSVAAV